MQQGKQRALANQLYINQFLSADGRYAILMIQNDAYSSVGQEEDLLSGFENTAAPVAVNAAEHPPFLSGEENTEIVNAVEKIAAKYNRLITICLSAYRHGFCPDGCGLVVSGDDYGYHGHFAYPYHISGADHALIPDHCGYW